MSDHDPAQLAMLDQSMALIDDRVAHYTSTVAEMIRRRGREVAAAEFHAWLRAQPPEATAALAVGALVRLAASGTGM